MKLRSLLFGIIALTAIAFISAGGVLGNAGCGKVGEVSADDALDDSGDGVDSSDQAIASGSLDPSAVVHGASYRPPSLPPVIDHPSFIVIASPSFESGTSPTPGQLHTLSIDGQIISQLTGQPVPNEPVTGVQVRMVSVPMTKSLRVMHYTVAADQRAVEVDVQHDTTDADGHYLFIFEDFECGDEIWIASPSSNTVVLQPCDDQTSAASSSPDSDTALHETPLEPFAPGDTSVSPNATPTASSSTNTTASNVGAPLGAPPVHDDPHAGAASSAPTGASSTSSGTTPVPLDTTVQPGTTTTPTTTPAPATASTSTPTTTGSTTTAPAATTSGTSTVPTDTTVQPTPTSTTTTTTPATGTATTSTPTTTSATTTVPSTTSSTTSTGGIFVQDGAAATAVVAAGALRGTTASIVVRIDAVDFTVVQDLLHRQASQVELVVAGGGTAAATTTPDQGMVVSVGNTLATGSVTTSTMIAATSMKDSKSKMEAVIATAASKDAKAVCIKIDRVGSTLKTSYSPTCLVGSYIGIATKTYPKDSLGSAVGVTVKTIGKIAAGSVKVTTASTVRR